MSRYLSSEARSVDGWPLPEAPTKVVLQVPEIPDSHGRGIEVTVRRLESANPGENCAQVRHWIMDEGGGWVLEELGYLTQKAWSELVARQRQGCALKFEIVAPELRN